MQKVGKTGKRQTELGDTREVSRVVPMIPSPSLWVLLLKIDQKQSFLDPLVFRPSSYLIPQIDLAWILSLRDPQHVFPWGRAASGSMDGVMVLPYWGWERERRHQARGNMAGSDARHLRYFSVPIHSSTAAVWGRGTEPLWEAVPATSTSGATHRGLCDTHTSPR